MKKISKEQYDNNNELLFAIEINVLKAIKSNFGNNTCKRCSSCCSCSRIMPREIELGSGLGNRIGVRS